MGTIVLCLYGDEPATFIAANIAYVTPATLTNSTKVVLVNGSEVIVKNVYEHVDALLQDALGGAPRE